MGAANDLLLDGYDRIAQSVPEVLDGLGTDDAAWRPDEGSNSVGWLVWHLTRVQDSHVAEAWDVEQLWSTGEWAARFGLDPDPQNTGYGHTPDDVARVRPEDAAALVDYFDAVDARTRGYLTDLTPDQLDRIVDRRWNPPVTLGARLISVADDDIQHAGQAAYLRGLLDR